MVWQSLRVISSYDSNCIANVDETGLFNKSSRKSTFVSGTEAKDKELRGLKQSKERLKILVGAFMSGE